MHGGSAKFSDLYELQEDIGVGSYSICKRCVHRITAMDYAVKVELTLAAIGIRMKDGVDGCVCDRLLGGCTHSPHLFVVFVLIGNEPS